MNEIDELSNQIKEHAERAWDLREKLGGLKTKIQHLLNKKCMVELGIKKGEIIKAHNAFYKVNDVKISRNGYASIYGHRKTIDGTYARTKSKIMTGNVVELYRALHPEAK